jgi:hypothetical protein
MTDPDTTYVKWAAVSAGPCYGPFETEADAQQWIRATWSEGFSVRRLYPGMIS